MSKDATTGSSEKRYAIIEPLLYITPFLLSPSFLAYGSRRVIVEQIYREDISAKGSAKISPKE